MDGGLDRRVRLHLAHDLERLLRGRGRGRGRGRVRDRIRVRGRVRVRVSY